MDDTLLSVCHRQNCDNVTLPYRHAEESKTLPHSSSLCASPVSYNASCVDNNSSNVNRPKPIAVSREEFVRKDTKNSVDEANVSKIMKRKYHRGYVIEGRWIFDGKKNG